MTILSKIHPVTWLGGLGIIVIGGFQFPAACLAAGYVTFMTCVLRNER